jgi:hypothetical protein
VNESFRLLQYTFGVSLADLETSVLRIRPTGNGIRYMQLDAFAASGAQGAALVDALGQVRGVRMSTPQMVGLFGSVFGEQWAIESQILANHFVPLLDTGLFILDPAENTCSDSASRPPIPTRYRGDVTNALEPLAVGEVVYARVRGGGAEEWFSSTVTNEGRFFISIGTCTEALENGSQVDFFYDSAQAPQISSFVLEQSFVINLTFR